MIDAMIAEQCCWDHLKAAISATEIALDEKPSMALARRLGCLQAAQAALAEAMAQEAGDGG